MDRKKVIDYIHVDNLEYDPENPRLPSTLIKVNDESEVIDWMLKDASIIELMGSIGEKGFFPAEPLLVVENHKRKGKFIVVEGNRRLTAVKLLRKPELAKRRSVAIKQICKEAKIKPAELPAIRFDKREQILDYLGFKHITGVKPWSALAKAKYLKSLQKEYKSLTIAEQYKHLAKAIGSRADYVEDLLTTLPVYEKIAENDFFNINDLDEDNIDFGVYYNALKWQNIADFIGVDVRDKNPIKKLKLNNLKKLAKWVSEKDSSNKTRLVESRNLSRLNDVIGNDDALKQFENGRTLQDALLYTQEPYKTFQSLIVDSLEKLKQAHSYSPHVKESAMADINIVEELLDTAKDLRLVLNNKLKAK